MYEIHPTEVKMPSGEKIHSIVSLGPDGEVTIIGYTTSNLLDDAQTMVDFANSYKEVRDS